MNRSVSSRFLYEATNQHWSRFLHEAIGYTNEPYTDERVGTAVDVLHLGYVSINLRRY